MKEIVLILLIMVLIAHVQSSSVYLRSELNDVCWIELLY